MSRSTAAAKLRDALSAGQLAITTTDSARQNCRYSAMVAATIWRLAGLVCRCHLSVRIMLFTNHTLGGVAWNIND